MAMDPRMAALADMAGTPQGGGMVDEMMKAPAPKGPEAIEGADPVVAAVGALEALVDSPTLAPDAKALVMELLSKLGAKSPKERPAPEAEEPEEPEEE